MFTCGYDDGARRKACTEEVETDAKYCPEHEAERRVKARIPLSPNLAMDQFLNRWSDMEGIGSALSCGEVDTLADLFIAMDRPGLAAALLQDHAYEDDCGDEHCICDDSECIADRAAREE